MKLDSKFPMPNPDAIELSNALSSHIKEMILNLPQQKEFSHELAQKQNDSLGIPFSQFFDACMYTPGFGYYSNGLKKFGAKGDFITAPELSPVFSYCLGNQILEISEQLDHFNILEVGAGTGIMCADILDHLKSLNSLPAMYYILERSGTLKNIQQTTIKKRHPDFFDHVIWLDEPFQDEFEGIIIGNEIVDALSVSRFIIENDVPFYLDVGLDQSKNFIWKKRAADKVLINFIDELNKNNIYFPNGYISEFCHQLSSFIAAISGSLKKGALILIDYGYTQKEYYHPLRNTGTLIAHYQHRAHESFFDLIGLQDLTANVDFTALANAALEIGLDVLGFTTQSLFLYGLGLEAILQKCHQNSTDLEWYAMAQKVQQLVLPSEMGERFNVMLMGKNIEGYDLKGFKLRDFRHTL